MGQVLVTPTDPALFIYLCVGMLLMVAAAALLERFFPDWD